jgi:exodeoxyribonuclease III
MHPGAPGYRIDRCPPGDYNVVPTPQDIYQTRSLDNNALVQPESREAFAQLLAQGWTNALRKLHPEGPLGTFWDYKRDRWPADKGMRLDHLLLSRIVSQRLANGSVDRWVRGEENASDHAPAWIVPRSSSCTHALIGFRNWRYHMDM